PALTGAPVPAGELSAYVTPSGLNNVVYRGADGHLHGLWFNGNGPVGWDDLTWASAGAPLPGATDPSAYFFAQNGTHHVLYTTINGHLHELTWTTGAVTHTDLTTAGPSTAPYGK